MGGDGWRAKNGILLCSFSVAHAAAGPVPRYRVPSASRVFPVMPIDSRTSEGPDDLHWEALARFHAGESAPDEVEAIRRHLASAPAERELLSLLSRDQENESSSSDAVDVDAALVAVRRRLIAVDESAPPVLTIASGGRVSVAAASAKPRRWFGAAAAIAAVLAVAVALTQWMRTDATGPLEPARTVVTAPMQQDTLLLADGTRIRVAPGSRLTIDSGYHGTHRTLHLEGAAYFTVSHDGAHPFIVRTTAGEVRDIGTAFVVKTVPDGQTIVAVTEGQVRITRAGERASVDLYAGDRAEMAMRGSSNVLRNVVTADDTAWTSGRLVYHDARVAEVLADLQRWYGTSIDADSIVAKSTLQAELPTDSLSNTLRIVGLAVGAEVETRNGGYYLRVREGTRPR